ncbi:MAG: MFS transporter [Nitrososphaerota archaeon]|nr:MFS transporter [Nitrososphaerota archaeon]
MQQQSDTYSLKERALVTVLSSFGSYVEWYDYFVAATAAALIWPTVFFSQFSALATGISIASFGVAYFTRPVGAYIFGHMGDRLGRRSTLVWTLLTVGVAMLGITLLPSSNVIGMWGPILLFSFRAVQGVGFGGEYGGASSWVLEVNAKSRWRGTWTSSVMATIGLGGGTGALLYLFLEKVYSRAVLLNYGWRIPFALGVVLLFSAALIRYLAQESDVFTKLQKLGKTLKTPASTAIRKHIGLMMLIGLSWVFIFWINPGVIQLFATPYLAKHGVPPTFTTYVLAVSDFVIPFATLLGGFISDLLGRRKAVFISALLTLLFAYPYLVMLESANLAYILLAEVVINVFVFIGEGSFTPYVIELFRTEYRYSGGGLSYQFAALYAGILFTFALPTILLSSYETTYILAIAMILPLVTAFTVFFLKETSKSDISG